MREKHKRPEQRVYSVEEFCEAHGIGRSHFYILLRNNRGPKTMRLGRRRLISREAARDWRRQLETAPVQGVDNES